MNKEKIKHILKNTSAIIVILSMLVIIYYLNRDLDFFNGTDESEGVVTETEEGSSSFFTGDAARLTDEVVHVSTTSMRVFDEDGEGEKIAIALSEPILFTEGDYAVCYNKNSTEATVYRRIKESYSIKTKNKIIRAKVNDSGYLFLATEKEGYNCECMVYNKSGEPIFKWDISKSQFLDGDINSKNNAIAISLATAGNQKLLGEILFLDITEAEEIARHSSDATVYFSVDYNMNNTLTAVGSHSLEYYNSDGSKKWFYSYNDKTLLKADVSNPDIMVLAFEQSGSGVKGNSTEVVTINRLGREIGKKTFDYIADDMSVSKSAVAIAFGKEIYIADKELDIKKRLMSESGVNKIVLFDDEAHVFVISGSGGKIIK